MTRQVKVLELTYLSFGTFLKCPRSFNLGKSQSIPPSVTNHFLISGRYQEFGASQKFCTTPMQVYKILMASQRWIFSHHSASLSGRNVQRIHFLT